MKKLTLTLLFLSLLTLMNSRATLALPPQGFSCAVKSNPEHTITKPASCDDTHGFGLITETQLKRPELKKLFEGKSEDSIEKDKKLKDLALEAKFRTTSNMNGAKFTFPSGITRVVFRGSYLAPEFSAKSVTKRTKADKVDQGIACMNDLVSQYKLSKIVNYDELDWPSAVMLTQEESDELKKLNPKSHYWKFIDAAGRTFQYKIAKAPGTTEAEKKKFVFDDIFKIIQEIEGNKDDLGAVYIHCYGGHHRTGVVYGVLQKCIGKTTVDEAVQEYKCHIGFESETKKGGYHPDNETVIREFPCEQYFPAHLSAGK